MMHDQLKWLLDYTLFHIGAYITLSTLLVGLLGLESFKQRISTMKPFLFLTLICFMIAGACGGVVASNIPYFDTFKDLTKPETTIGPFFGRPMWPLVTWTSMEHVAFWFGVGFAFAGTVVTACGRRKRVPSASDTAEFARRLGKECYEASTSARHEDRVELTNIAEQLRKLADQADKSATA